MGGVLMGDNESGVNQSWNSAESYPKLIQSAVCTETNQPVRNLEALEIQGMVIKVN